MVQWYPRTGAEATSTSGCRMDDLRIRNRWIYLLSHQQKQWISPAFFWGFHQEKWAISRIKHPIKFGTYNDSWRTPNSRTAVFFPVFFDEEFQKFHPPFCFAFRCADVQTTRELWSNGGKARNLQVPGWGSWGSCGMELSRRSHVGRSHVSLGPWMSWCRIGEMVKLK